MSELWRPSPTRIADANLTRFMGCVNARRGTQLREFGELYAWSLAEPGHFWSELARFADVRADWGAGPLIEHAELIEGPYNLEVSSPGAERPLRAQSDYERFNGKRVNIRYRSGDTDTVVEGQLVAVDGAGIAVQAVGARGRAPVVMHIAWSDVVAGRLAVSI